MFALLISIGTIGLVMGGIFVAVRCSERTRPSQRNHCHLSFEEGYEKFDFDGTSWWEPSRLTFPSGRVVLDLGSREEMFYINSLPEVPEEITMIDDLLRKGHFSQGEVERLWRAAKGSTHQSTLVEH